MTARILIPATLFVLVALGATGSALAGSQPAKQERPVVETCENGFRSSSADNTCSNEKFEKVLNYRCRVTADCNNSSGGTTRTWKTVGRNDANRLVNCSGNLKIDNC